MRLIRLRFSGAANPSPYTQTFERKTNMKYTLKRLPEFATYFNPKIWRHWRNFTYYRIFGDLFLVIDRFA